MSFFIRPMSAEDYQAVYALWTSIDGMDLNPPDDNSEAISAFLQFNPELNYVAVAENEIVGVIMCGFDGRRATIYHAAVAPHYRRQGIGSALLDQLENKLQAKAVTKGRLLAFKTNTEATAFWQQFGWKLQPQLNYFSKNFI